VTPLDRLAYMGKGGMGAGDGMKVCAHYCKGTFRSGLIYIEKQSPECGLWN
jgi:hypothetical protein